MKKSIKYEQIIIPLITLILGFLISPFKSYLEKDFQDLATKKNIAEIAAKIEEIKSQYIAQNDSLRVQLSRESEAITKHREVYTKIAKSARIFIQQNYSKELEKEFLLNYSEIWLWASDSVIIKLNKFIDYEMLLSSGKVQKNDIKQKRLYSDFLMALRKDVGFETTKLKTTDFIYFYF